MRLTKPPSKSYRGAFWLPLTEDESLGTECPLQPHLLIVGPNLWTNQLNHRITQEEIVGFQDSLNV